MMQARNPRPHAYDPVINFMVAEWPWSAQDHSDGLEASIERNTRIQAEKRNNALAVELRALDAKATAGPWEVDTEKSEGEYGAGPDTTVGYDVSMIIGPDGLSLFDALNSTAASIQEEYDEDWRVSYDEVSARNAALIVAIRNNLPAILAALEGDE